MENLGNVTVGRPQTKPTAPAHVRGVREGNWPGERAGHRAAPNRSTGIAVKARQPIDPRSPNLTPA